MTLDKLIGEIPINIEVRNSIQSNSDIPDSEKPDLQNRVDDFFSGRFILLDSILDFNISQDYMHELLKNPTLAIKLMREYSQSQYQLNKTSKPHILEIKNNNKFKGLIYPIHTSRDRFALYAECVLKFSRFENKGRGVFVFDYNSTQADHTITTCKFYFAMDKKWQNYLLETLLRFGLRNYLQSITNLLGRDAKALARNFTKDKEEIIRKIKNKETKESYSREDMEYLQNLFGIYQNPDKVIYTGLL